MNQFVCNANFQLVVTGYDPAYNKIILGEGCGFYKSKNTCNPITNYEGIHTLFSTIVHEVEHAKIECDVWQYTHSSHPNIHAGFSSLWDIDGDGYKDIWELNSVPGMLYGFTVNPGNPTNVDAYSSNYGVCFCAGSCSAGTMFEEIRCRNVEAALNYSLIDNDDWSFDPTNKIQGKQWK
ncbi:hypothetical protein [Reichenbachiella sp.]|uniref:hypothetical protein n=1 Tax=Reichenbachiella sp. TaxID=2184521 RepID=UPI003B5BE622